MSKPAVLLLLAFLLAISALGASYAVGFVAPIILLALGVIVAVFGIVLDVRAQRGNIR